MILILAIAATLAYLTAAAYVARWLYGHSRANYLDNSMKSAGNLGLAWHIDQFERIWQGGYVGAALFQGALWPVALPIRALWFLVRSFVQASRIRSRTELEAESATRAKRIRQLEQQLGYPSTTEGGRP